MALKKLVAIVIVDARRDHIIVNILRQAVGALRLQKTVHPFGQSVQLQHCNPISFPSVGQCVSGGFPLPSFCLYYMRRSLLLQAAICTKLQKLFVYIPLFRHSVHNDVASVRVTRTVPPMLPAWYRPRKGIRRTQNRPRCGLPRNETAAS